MMGDYMEKSLKLRLKNFRRIKGYSQDELAKILGVGKITIFRWENGTSKPSTLYAEKLREIGFGEVSEEDTKKDSIPRIILNGNNSEGLRDSIRKHICISNNNLEFVPSSYVINGPKNQISFFEKLYQIQEKKEPTIEYDQYLKRLSLISKIGNNKISTSQFLLEKPSVTAKHWNTNYGTHGSHRYIGRFPPHLIRALLNSFGAKPGDTICDPFAGSGTTLVESRLLGIKAIGVEICPLSIVISRAKCLFPKKIGDLLELNNIIKSMQEFYTRIFNEYYDKIKRKSLTHEEIIKRNGNSIPTFSNISKWFTPEALLGASIIVEFLQKYKSYQRDFLCCAFSSCMRSIGNIDVDVVRAEFSKEPRKNVDVLALVLRACHKLLKSIENSILSHGEFLKEPTEITILQSSILDAKIKDESIDYIITSPPYGTEAISYLRTHLLSYRCLEPILKYDPYYFNKKIIGSEFLNNKKETIDKEKFEVSSEKFKQFFNHEVKELDSEKLLSRKLMMGKFFYDMEKVTQLFSKWIKNNGKIGFVIGNKKIGDRIIPTDEIISEIFENYGFYLEDKISHKLKCSNTNSEVPWQERTIQDEFVLIFKKN
jgi:site-specific DNA-methyltransferase (cytosine-N4-specific)